MESIRLNTNAPEKPATADRRSLDRALLLQLVSFHLVLDIVLLLLTYVSSPSGNATVRWLLATLLLGVPLAQTSLLAVWVWRGHIFGSWRFAISVPILVGLWRLLVHYPVALGGSPVALSACWLIGMVTQFGTISVGMGLLRISELGSWRAGLRIGVPAMMCWMVGLGMAFSFYRLSPVDFRIRGESNVALLSYVMTLSLWNALAALVLVVSQFWKRRWLVALVGLTAPLVLTGVAGLLAGRADWWSDLRLFLFVTAASQSVILMPSFWLAGHQMRLVPAVEE